MLRQIQKIWHRIRDWVSQWLTPQSPRNHRPLLSTLNAVERGQELSDTDFEFVFSQLLEGVAHGWHEGRIVKFFDQLGERGQSRYWVPWLERFGEKVLASPTPNLPLADRLLRLGSMAQAFSQTAPLGEVAYGIGRQLYARASEATVWDYQGPDEAPLTSAETSGEVQQLTREELFDLLQQDEMLRKTIADQMGILSDDPQEIIDFIVEKAEADQAEDSQLEDSQLTDESRITALSANEMIAEGEAENPSEVGEKTRPASPDLIDQWFELGIQQAEAGKFEGALTSWDNALALDPNLAEAWQNRAAVLGRIGRWEEALDNIEKAIALDPEEPAYWLVKGSIRCGLDQWDEAIRDWDQVIAFNSESYEAWYNRGLILEQQLENIPEAIESYRKVLLIKPDFEVAQEHLQALLIAPTDD